MLENDTLIKVMNRDTGRVGYTLSEFGVRRQFAPKEIKEIPYQELKSLSYDKGGKALLDNYLIIQNEEAVAALLRGVEPEYYYTEADVIKLMKTGSLDAFLDCLDFAPEGVKEIIKDQAVELPLNDMNKREAIFEKLGFNVTEAIKVKNTKFDDGSEDNQSEQTKTRRVQPAEPAGTQRRAAEPPKYNVTSISE